MICTSYHPTFRLGDMPRGREDHPDWRACKTVEFARLWYAYIRAVLPPNEHIVIVDQCAPYPIEELTSCFIEPFEYIDGFTYNPSVRIHIKRFDNRVGKLAGVKRLYLYLYELCWRANVDMFFVEMDCLVTEDVVTSSRDHDFATNYVYIKERVCDTFLCKVSAQRLHEKDCFWPLPEYLAHLRGMDTYRGERWVEDDVCMLLCERGLYAQFCYGNVMVFNRHGILHNEANTKLLALLEAKPIAHPIHADVVEALRAKLA